MPENLFAEKLAHFKQNEKPEVVLVVAGNAELVKIAVAWTNLDVRCAENLSELNSKSESEIWRWLWRNTKFSLAELRAKTGVAYGESVLASKLEPLIGNRILYPDGTVNSFVQRYMREQGVRLFEVKQKKTAKRPG